MCGFEWLTSMTHKGGKSVFRKPTRVEEGSWKGKLSSTRLKHKPTEETQNEFLRKESFAAEDIFVMV